MAHDSPEKTSILVIDDDEIILVALAETIRQEGYHIESTTSPSEALERLKKRNFAVIISDQRMSEMSGLEFFDQAKAIQPLASRILITGVLTLTTIIDAVNRGEIFRFIAKPWIREELLVTIRNAVQRFELLTLNRKLQADLLNLNEQLSTTNFELQKNIRELTEKQQSLDHANQALARNFEHSLDLCHRILTAYHPLLGQETKSVVDLCRLMCEHGNLSPRDQHILTTAAWLRNLGLIGLSRDLLLRSRNDPASLKESDRNAIRNAPLYAQTLAATIDEMEDVGLTIRASHERWDGSGFPDGLSGDSIPLTARYLAVAVFYVECGMPREEAIEEILSLSGTGFEPEAVRLFIKSTRLAPLPRKIREILFSELREGMVFARGLHSPLGLLLIPEGSRLTSAALRKIREHNEIDPIQERILIYQ